MRISVCTLKHFGSYAELTLDFRTRGLILVQGGNGSGKSTLCDVAPWLFFGKTAKGGNADAILSWPGDKVTIGSGTASTSAGEITVYRQRGHHAKDNDLYFTLDGSDPIRGKDLKDTQQLINNALGTEYSFFLSGAYMHEFSETVAFFTLAPKNRRSICEQIVDLSFVKNLQTKGSDKRKSITKQLQQDEKDLSLANSLIAQNKASALKMRQKAKDYDTERASIIANLERSANTFESNRTNMINQLTAKLEDLSAHLNEHKDTPDCPTCGTPTADRDVVHELKRQIQQSTTSMQSYNSLVNPYTASLQNAAAQLNLYAEQADELDADREELQKEADKISSEVVKHRQTTSDLETLEDILVGFRASIITRTIKELEVGTNKLLTDHFDSEIQVVFESTEDVEIDIYKNGNQCIYSQLSKGQRQMLKLCFAVSVMRQVADHNKVNFTQLMFDEALDGLEDSKKKRAYGLFETLSLQYESVFVVDHSESFKALFDNTISVQLIDGISTITEG